MGQNEKSLIDAKRYDLILALGFYLLEGVRGLLSSHRLGSLSFRTYALNVTKGLLWMCDDISSISN